MSTRRTQRKPMAAVIKSGDLHGRPDRIEVPIRQGERVFPVFWIVACCLAASIIALAPLQAPVVGQAATALFVAGGLPHGAYDISLLHRTYALGRRTLVLAVGAYIAIAVATAGLWMTAPLFALMAFLIIAAVHFGEDWLCLDDPLLKFAAGAAVSAAAVIGHPAEVAQLFVKMSDPRGVVVSEVLIASAPVILLVTCVGIVIAWREGSKYWAAAMAVCIILLLLAPPVVGFALFFVFLHSPRHLADTRLALGAGSRLRWVATGVALSVAVVLGWIALHTLVPRGYHVDFTPQAFQLLASVAVPHLLLSQWLVRRLDRHGAAGMGSGSQGAGERRPTEHSKR